jgi:hypothetical protein
VKRVIIYLETKSDMAVNQGVYWEVITLNFLPEMKNSML